MQTTTFQEVLYAAAEFAARSRDQLPDQEYPMTQGFLAAELQRLWNTRPWPDLVPPVLNVTAANGQFSKEQQGAVDGWLGLVLGVYTQNPQTPACAGAFFRRPRALSFYDGDGVVYLDTPRESVWVEYMRPYPSQAFPDINPVAMTTANFLAAKCPLRFRYILAHKAAAHLFKADLGPPFFALEMQLGEQELANEILRMPSPPPWRRTIRLAYPRRGGHRWC